MTRLFYDPFDDPLDLSKWNVRELNQSWTDALCYIHPSMVKTADGKLCLMAQPGVMGTKKFLGGRVDTRGKFDIRPGMEVRVYASLPKNPACWPGIWDGDYDDAPWLQPQNIPPKEGGERDYAETGLQNGAEGVTQTFITHNHSGIPRAYVPLDVAAYHWYIMRDYGDRITLAIDDKDTFTAWRKDQAYWPFDAAQPFKLILDLDLLRPITAPETMYVDTVEILSLPVSVPAPGPVPTPEPTPTPPPSEGGTMQLQAPLEGQSVSSPVNVVLALEPPYPVGLGQYHFKRLKDGLASYVYTLKDQPKFAPGVHALRYELVDAAHLPVPGVAPVIVTFTVIGGEAPLPSVEQQIRTSLKKAPPYGLGWSDAMVERVLR